MQIHKNESLKQPRNGQGGILKGKKKNEHNQIANGEHPENFRMKCEQQLTGNHL